MNAAQNLSHMSHKFLKTSFYFNRLALATLLMLLLGCGMKTPLQLPTKQADYSTELGIELGIELNKAPKQLNQPQHIHS